MFLLLREVLVNRFRTWTLLMKVNTLCLNVTWRVDWSWHSLLTILCFQRDLARQCLGLRVLLLFKPRQKLLLSKLKTVLYSFLTASCWLNVLYLHTFFNWMNGTVRRLSGLLFFSPPKSYSETMNWSLKSAASILNFLLFHLQILVAWTVAPCSLVLRNSWHLTVFSELLNGG